jgi:hypothetical protein
MKKNNSGRKTGTTFPGIDLSLCAIPDGKPEPLFLELLVL